MNKKSETIENLLNILKRWQGIEDDSIRNTTEIIKKSNNSVVNIIMEIIRQDSVMHRKIQQLIVDNYTKKPIAIDREELTEIWDLIVEHDEAERKTIELANYALAQIDDPIVKLLLEYLLLDESKHDKLLTDLEKYKDSVYPEADVLPYV